jgi:hypothetical protein
MKNRKNRIMVREVRRSDPDILPGLDSAVIQHDADGTDKHDSDTKDSKDSDGTDAPS